MLVSQSSLDAGLFVEFQPEYLDGLHGFHNPGQVVRFHHVGIRTQIIRPFHIPFLVGCRENDDGQILELGLPPHPFQHLKPASNRHFQVQQHHHRYWKPFAVTMKTAPPQVTDRLRPIVNRLRVHRKPRLPARRLDDDQVVHIIVNMQDIQRASFHSAFLVATNPPS
ncbi:MAG: hypothetical protein JWR26_4786 [Pedosphaera sp.]|nr:hypothetical protein [Pedosphaera sp.]